MSKNNKVDSTVRVALKSTLITISAIIMVLLDFVYAIIHSFIDIPKNFNVRKSEFASSYLGELYIKSIEFHHDNATKVTVSFNVLYLGIHSVNLESDFKVSDIIQAINDENLLNLVAGSIEITKLDEMFNTNSK